MTPLPTDYNRCLAHGHLAARETCVRADRCARHVSIRFDPVFVPAEFRCCVGEDMARFVPLDEDVDAA